MVPWSINLLGFAAYAFRTTQIFSHTFVRRHPRSRPIEKPASLLGRGFSDRQRTTTPAKACIEVCICQRLSRAQHLTTLLDSQNRLQPATDHVQALGAFRSVYELQLNTTLTPWNAMQDIIHYMPALRVIEMGYNRIRSLSAGPGSHASLEELNLDSNLLSNWSEICAALRSFTA